MVVTEERTRTGTLLGKLVLVVATLAVIAAATVGAVKILSPQPVQTRFGEGEYQFETGPDGADRVRNCEPKTVLSDKRCGDLKVLIISAGSMPWIARNVKLAWAEGKPSLLHRESTERPRRYRESCGRFTKTYTTGSCDDNAELPVIPR